MTPVVSDIAFRVGATQFHARCRPPSFPLPRPAVLISLAGTVQDALKHENHRRIPDIFTAAGHYVAGFDLPNHGTLVDSYGAGLAGMAAAMAEGHDVFGRIGHMGRALIDAAWSQGIGSGGVLAFGTSRGGLGALHIAAADKRVVACAVRAPLTHIPALQEFAHLSDAQLVKQSNALALVDRLRDRPVFVDTGMSDPRVGADHCREFHAALCAASRHLQPVLFTAPGESHGDASYPSELGLQAAAGFLLARYAEHIRGSIRS